VKQKGHPVISPSGNRPGRDKGKEEPMNEEVGAARAFWLEDGEGNARWWGGGLATIKATGQGTGGLYSIVEVLEARGAQAPLHLHRKEDEGFWILEGEMTFHVGEETIKASPGSFVFGPKDVPHTYTVDSGPARLLFLLSPAGFEGFVEAVSKPAKARTLPPSKSEGPSDEDDTSDEAESESFAVLETRYGCEIVGRPPGRQPSLEQGKEKSMNEDVARAYGLEEGEGEARSWLGVSLATIKATGKETGGRYTLVEVREPEGEEAPLHVHHNEDEAFWVLEGGLTFQIGDETIKASPGSFLFGPKGVPHRYTVESGPARMLFLLSPAGFEDFIYATSEPARERTLPPAPDGPPDEAEMEQLAALARHYGAELLI
jgi:quercetin dioxygenase-like cupin family protein